jgi:general nucleoside transport system permease protein
MDGSAATLPSWAERGLVPLAVMLVPLASLAAAFLMVGMLLLALGLNPLAAIRILLQGSLGTLEGIGFTAYYATSFIFAGLAVSVAFHAGLFNIGGEGQAVLAGLGAAMVALALPQFPGPWLAALCVLAAACLGGLYGLIPGWLQATRGSHVVITTIMFNFLAAILLVYLLVGPLGKAGSMSPETAEFARGAQLMPLHSLLGLAGIPFPETPLNVALVLALASTVLVWLLIYRSRLGYAIRTVGANPRAAAYAGISPQRITMLAMTLSGALAGGIAVNEVLGVQHRLVLDFTAGHGFVGIAVALMGRAHPAGIVLASILFGVLYQGGAELSFEMPAITRDIVVVIGGVIILFAGALDGMFRQMVARLLRPVTGRMP